MGKVFGLVLFCWVALPALAASGYFVYSALLALGSANLNGAAGAWALSVICGVAGWAVSGIARDQWKTR